MQFNLTIQQQFQTNLILRHLIRIILPVNISIHFPIFYPTPWGFKKDDKVLTKQLQHINTYTRSLVCQNNRLKITKTFWISLLKQVLCLVTNDRWKSFKQFFCVVENILDASISMYPHCKRIINFYWEIFFWASPCKA